MQLKLNNEWNCKNCDIKMQFYYNVGGVLCKNIIYGIYWIFHHPLINLEKKSIESGKTFFLLNNPPDTFMKWCQICYNHKVTLKMYDFLVLFFKLTVKWKFTLRVPFFFISRKGSWWETLTNQFMVNCVTRLILIESFTVEELCIYDNIVNLLNL